MTKPVDRVQLQKQESASGGGDAADQDEFLSTCPLDPHEDAPEVQGVFFQPPSPSVLRDENVYLGRDVAGNMLFRDAVDATERTLSDLLSGGGGGLLPGTHRVLDQLVHDIAENFFVDFDYLSSKKKRVTRMTYWTDASMTTKIRESLITYGSGDLKKKPIEVATIQFDGSGTEVERLTESITYDDKKVLSVQGVLT